MRGLEKALQGKTIEKVELKRPNLRFPFPTWFEQALEGQRLEGFSRRAKYMLWHLSSGAKALMHLRMSRFVLDGTIAAHDHVVHQIGGHEVRYNDPRRFGFMDVILPGQASKFLTHLGPEPLGNTFNGAYLHEQLKGRSTPIKARLLDQKVVVGVGNIYCCEALFRAHIHPARPAKTIEPEQAETLASQIKDVLGEAIAAGGSSIRDYVQADGQPLFPTCVESLWARGSRAGCAKRPSSGLCNQGAVRFFALAVRAKFQVKLWVSRLAK